MAKLKLTVPLAQRLKHYAETRDRLMAEAGDNESYRKAIQLQYKMRVVMQKWIQSQESEDAADVSNAVLAVANDVLEAGLRIASEDPTIRGAIIGRYLTQFTHNAIQSKLINPPSLPPQQEIAENAIGRINESRSRQSHSATSLLGPDGKPYKVQ